MKVNDKIAINNRKRDNMLISVSDNRKNIIKMFITMTVNLWYGKTFYLITTYIVPVHNNVYTKHDSFIQLLRLKGDRLYWGVAVRTNYNNFYEKSWYIRH